MDLLDAAVPHQVSFEQGPLAIWQGGAVLRVEFGGTVVADFDGDGKSDLLVSTSDQPVDDLGLSTWLCLSSSRPGGGARTRVECGGKLPYQLAAADLDGDHILDLLIADCGGQSRLFLGKGDGSFAPGVPTAQSYENAVTADIDGDGNVDLLANWAQGFDVLFSGGRKAVTTAGHGGAWQAGDLNSDGHLDVLGYPGAEVLLGRGDGTFTPVKELLAKPTGYHLGDFNGDGRLDLASAGIFCAGRGDGTFAPAQMSQATGLQSAGAADFDGDGRLDFLLIRFPQKKDWEFGIGFGNGDGTFADPVAFEATWRQSSRGGRGLLDWCYAADFNGDGKPDVGGVNRVFEGKVAFTMLNTRR